MLIVTLSLLYIIFVVVIILIVKGVITKEYKKLERQIYEELKYLDLKNVSYYDEVVIVNSRQSLNNYDATRFFKENRNKLVQAQDIISMKNQVAFALNGFLANNRFKNRTGYNIVEKQLKEIAKSAASYRINVKYISPAGNNLGENDIWLNQYEINRFVKDPSLLMSKGEYSHYLKELQKKSLEQKCYEYYESVNRVIDYANRKKDTLIIKGSVEQLDDLVDDIYEKAGKLKRIKTTDSEEWGVIGKSIAYIERNIRSIVAKNQRVLEYYNSTDFLKIKETCNSLMSTQVDFNEYIEQKAKSISQLFGVRFARSETINNDEYRYIRPYKKTISPFTAEVSAAVFSSAENSPLEYLIKYFYPNKEMYPEQIQKLQLLVEELETLKEAKVIIDNHKKDYQQYLDEVPSYVISDDESGFYSRLGLANIDEKVLEVEYKFAYTSGGGMAKRSFPIPMTEENIVELIKALESKLTLTAFTKEQRNLMTKKLREYIKKRDNYTCCECGISIYGEPNLLLEIDHIKPVSKGGYTEENNLRTLCWKCNRSKGSKFPNEQ